MASASSLATLIDLAVQGVDDAGKLLQKLATDRKNAESQLATLLVYRQDYADRLQKSAESGVSASNYHNFRQFIATLDEAISQQNSVVAQIDARVEQGRQQWYAQKRRLNSFEALRERQVQHQVVRNNRIEQRASDEVSATIYRRLHHSH